MTAILNMLLLSAGGIVISPLSPGASNGESLVGTNATGRVQFTRAGGISYLGLTSETGGLGPTLWATAPNATIGDSVWIKCTVTAGTLTTNPATTPTQLNTTRSFEKGPVSAGVSSATCTFDFYADSGGTVLLSSSAGWVISYTHV